MHRRFHTSSDLTWLAVATRPRPESFFAPARQSIRLSGSRAPVKFAVSVVGRQEARIPLSGTIGSGPPHLRRPPPRHRPRPRPLPPHPLRSLPSATSPAPAFWPSCPVEHTKFVEFRGEGFVPGSWSSAFFWRLGHGGSLSCRRLCVRRRRMGKGAPAVAQENPKAKVHLGTFSAPPPLCLVPVIDRTRFHSCCQARRLPGRLSSGCSGCSG